MLPQNRSEGRHAHPSIRRRAHILSAALFDGCAGTRSSKPPAPGAVPSFKIPPIEKRALANGLPVWIVEMHQVPVVDVSLIVKSGASVDPAGKYGVASYTAEMLDEGAGTRDALALADAVDFLGATLTTSSGFDASLVELHTLSSKLETALPLMADVVRRPTFPMRQMDRLREDRLTTLLQVRDNPQHWQPRPSVVILFGDHIATARPPSGTERRTRP